MRDISLLKVAFATGFKSGADFVAEKCARDSINTDEYFRQAWEKCLEIIEQEFPEEE